MMKNALQPTAETDLFRIIHKLPFGDSPYAKAKHAQVVAKDLEGAICWFWKAINTGDRVESALKDMAIVMKQLGRTEEAIQVITTLRGLCSKKCQDSLDNVLIDLYKKCGKMDEQINLIKQKLRQIYQGKAFFGKPTKTARSHGKKFQVRVEQEVSKLLGNLGWAYMQKNNYMAAEGVYRKAQMLDPDANKACNLGLCLIKQGRCVEARVVLSDVYDNRFHGSEDSKSKRRVEELRRELDLTSTRSSCLAQLPSPLGIDLEESSVFGLDKLIQEWAPLKSKRLPIFEKIFPLEKEMAS